MTKSIRIILQTVLCLLSITACSSEKAVSVENKTVEKVIRNDAITVYKSPSCGCCKEWVSYLEEEGYSVTSIDHEDIDSIKTKLGLPDPELKSCHTAIVDGYIIEGHVPVNDIDRLLAERPADIRGLSAPGMPMMSPGMGSRTPRDYAVLSFTESGDVAVYSQY